MYESKLFFTLIVLLSTNILCNKVDIIIFSYDRPLQLYALLESTKKYINNYNSIKLIYRTSNDLYEKAYQEIHQEFDDVIYLKQIVNNNSNNFKDLTLKSIVDSEYIIFLVDDLIVKDNVDLSECVKYLEETKAYAFYLKMGTHLTQCYSHKPQNTTLTNEQIGWGYSHDYLQPLPNYNKITANINAWQFNEGKHDWNYPNTLDMALYRKADIYNIFAKLNFNSPNTLEQYWSQVYPTNTLGLFYNLSKCVNLPINRVQNEHFNNHMNLYSIEELFQKFNSGLKIDIRPIFQVLNNDVHWEYEPQFILK